MSGIEQSATAYARLATDRVTEIATCGAFADQELVFERRAL